MAVRIDSLIHTQTSTHESGVQGTESPDGARGVPAQTLLLKQAAGLQEKL